MGTPELSGNTPPVGTVPDYDNCPDTTPAAGGRTVAGTTSGQTIYCLDDPSPQHPDTDRKPVMHHVTRSNRTKGTAGNVDGVPSFLPVVTNQKYRDAMTFCRNGNAFLQLVSDGTRLAYRDGLLYLDGLPATAGSIIQYFTDAGIGNINLPLLMMLYGIILLKFPSGCPKPPGLNGLIHIYYPDFARRLGKSNPNQDDITAFTRDMEAMKKIVGIIDGGEKAGSILPVLDNYTYAPDTNTISFSSPYIERMVTIIHDSSILRKNGKPLPKKNGGLQMLPAYSYIVDAGIVKERNKRAVEIVVIIVALIEQAGKNIPNIRADTIIGRACLLAQALRGQKTSHKNTILRRSFSKAWDLLRTRTSLVTVYKDIQLPSPEDPASVPTWSTLDMVFRFPHAGKSRTV